MSSVFFNRAIAYTIGKLNKQQQIFDSLDTSSQVLLKPPVRLFEQNKLSLNKRHNHKLLSYVIEL